MRLCGGKIGCHWLFLADDIFDAIFYSHFGKMGMGVDIGDDLNKIEPFVLQQCFFTVVNPGRTKLQGNSLSLRLGAIV